MFPRVFPLVEEENSLAIDSDIIKSEEENLLGPFPCFLGSGVDIAPLVHDIISPLKKMCSCGNAGLNMNFKIIGLVTFFI